jgi:Cd2+/Zn2+-exporting ATPase
VPRAAACSSRGGAHLENLRTLKAIAFDKTGTLTTGKPSVTDVIALQGDEASLLSTAASVESRSAHPLAQAVVQAARQRGLTWTEAEGLYVVSCGTRQSHLGRACANG